MTFCAACLPFNFSLLPQIIEPIRGKHIASLDSAFTSIDFQTDDSEWLASIPGLQIDLVSNRSDALNAIFRITAQGEGFTGSIDSHFERFREMYRQYDSALPIIRDVPTNPVLSL